MLAIASIVSFAFGFSALAVTGRFSAHAEQLETLAGFLFIGAFLLIGLTLPMAV